MPADVERAIPVIAERCEEIGRDPASLAVSVHIWGEPGEVPTGAARQERYLEYAGLGVSRVMVQGFSGVNDPRSLELLIDDCAGAGILNTT
jgi:hypothetical protein